MTRLPLFPLRSVLCPGVALPLHIFEERYRLMIARCIERDEPFGVVLLREGREVGPPTAAIAAVGTTAVIRRAGRYPDGRLDILTVGQRRFRLEAVDTDSEPYLVGRVSLLEEPVGPEQEVQHHAEIVGRRFLEYLQLLQPLGEADGPEIQIEFEVETEDEDEIETETDEPSGEGRLGPEPTGEADGPVDGPMAVEGGLIMDAADMSGQGTAAGALDAVDDLSPEERRELLMAAARRLLSTDDPTALSYVLTALVQVELATRQSLLEAPTTMDRLVELDRLLTRESWFLRQGLRPILIDASSLARRGS